MAKRCPKPRQRAKRPDEARDDYHGLLLDFQVWCKAHGYSFIEGMTLAINAFMATGSVSEDMANSGCMDATSGVRLGSGEESPRRVAPSGVQPCSPPNSQSSPP